MHLFSGQLDYILTCSYRKFIKIKILEEHILQDKHIQGLGMLFLLDAKSEVLRLRELRVGV